MGLITVVRHGQASSFGKSYDQLSELGKEQARLLGEFWASRDLSWDRVLVGPRLRHRETEELVANAYRVRGMPWPQAETMDDLNEIDMSGVAAHLAGRESSKESESLNLTHIPEAERPQALKAMFWQMSRVTKDFAAGRISVPNMETWAQFRLRGRRVLDALADSGKGKRVLALSSGGLTGMLVGSALGIDDDRTIDLMLQVRNASYTSFFYSPNRLTLTSFNSVPHLSADLWTVG